MLAKNLWHDKPSMDVLWIASIDPMATQRNTEQWASTGQRMDCYATDKILRSSVPSNPVKFENDCI